MRRSFAPFVVAVILAGALIVGLRVYFGGIDDEKTPPQACGAKLTVLASVEKAGLLRELAKSYKAEYCADVRITTSGSALQAFARGWDVRRDGPRPDVWSPASSSWLNVVRQRAENDDKGRIVGPDNPSIATSPLVIAMPKPMAEALGWPDKAIGWADLARLATDPKGWAAYGHPEWGQFRLGKTNPNFSTSGMNATIGAYFAATGGLSGDLTEQDVAAAKTRRFIQDLERSIVHYGDTTLTFLSNLQRADDAGEGLGYISAVTVEEKSLWDYNQGNPTGDPATLGKHDKPKVPLVAVYPKDGTLFSDSPYAVLSWADKARRATARSFLEYLREPEQQARFAEYAFRGHDGKAGKLITEENGLLPDEPAVVLRPPAPKVLDKLLRSWGELRKPANVLVVLDTSGSMGADVPGTGRTKLDLARQAAVNALPQFGSQDRVGLWHFASDHAELSPIGPMTRTHRSELTHDIRGLAPRGGTALYNTTLAAYQHVSAMKEGKAINAVVFLTDGKNEVTNTIALERLLPELRGRTIRVFTIAYGEDADLDVLRKISETTSAAAYDSRETGSIDQVFTAVISNF
ncbi:extracellular solute-binding protein [Nonomuraea sp. bgisy101]|uniref:extracellular solute-binding protein n=1 Tax=Nonomuraea sp. bgisy101 TaxID=3413784 RepID=UPI003D73D26A